MISKGLKQIQLADLTGIGRDSISGYVNGHNIPGNDRLKQIADVLKMKPEELLPDFGTPTGNGYNPSCTMRQDANGKDAWLTINRSLPMRLACQIIEMVATHDEKKAKA